MVWGCPFFRGNLKKIAPKWSLALVVRLLCLNDDFGDSCDFCDFLGLKEGKWRWGIFFCPFLGGFGVIPKCPLAPFFSGDHGKRMPSIP